MTAPIHSNAALLPAATARAGAGELLQPVPATYSGIPTARPEAAANSVAHIDTLAPAKDVGAIHGYSPWTARRCFLW